MTASYTATSKKFANGGNCVLEATWQVRSDLSIERIMEEFVASGQYRKGGVVFGGWLGVFNNLGIRYRKVSTYQHMSHKYMTLSQFAAKHPVGVFFVNIRGHALAVIHGKIIDPNFTHSGGKPKLKARVNHALLITNPLPAKENQKSRTFSGKGVYF